MSRLIKNASSLYAVQLVSFIIPLAEIPILARALGAGLYGQIVFCQALALALSIVVEYGFNINAAQQLAVCRDDTQKIARLFSDVLSAKLLLAAGLLVALGVSLLNGAFWAHIGTPVLLLFVLAYFLAFSFSPMWFFQGQERMSGVALLDVALRLVGLGILALTVHSADDFSWALLVLALPPLLNTTLTFAWARRQAGPLQLSRSGGWQQIRQGLHFFVYRSANSLVAAVVPVTLGLAAGKKAVGEFAPPEKLVKGMASLALPFLMAAFPVFARSFGTSAAANPFRVPLLTLGAIALVSCAGSLAGLALAPFVLDYMLGSDFSGALTIFYVLVGSVPLRIMNQSMVLVLLVPAGHSKQASYLTSAFAVLSVALGALAAVFHGGLGMAAALLAGEAMLFVSLSVLVFRVIAQAKTGRPVKSS